MLSEKPWKPEAVLLLFAGVFLCITLGATLMGGMKPHTEAGSTLSIPRVIVAVASFQGAALVLVQFFLRSHKTTWSTAFGLTNNWKRAVLLGAGGAIIFFPIGQGVQIAFAKLMTLFHQAPTEQTMVQALRLVHNSSERITMMSIAVFIVPVAEEILFRGILYPLVKQNGFPRLALWGVSVFFAVMHFNVQTFPALLILALFLTWLYENTNNLLAPIATHSLFNAINLSLFYFFESNKP